MPQHKSRKSHSPTTHSLQIVDSAAQKLNADIDRLSKIVFPRHPYLLSVPSDLPYCHSSRFVPTWFHGTPFDRREEQVQYLSFLPHQGKGEELLKVVGGWCDENGNLIDEPSPLSTCLDSGRNTPADSATRKKISLKDYRTKDKSAPGPMQKMPDEDVGQVHDLQSQSQAQTETSEVSSKMSSPRPGNTHREAQKEQSKVVEHQSPPPKPIPPLDGALPVSPSPPTPHDHVRSPRPLKKRKLSNSPEFQSTKAPKTESDVKSMPRLLSPTLPSPKSQDTLPELLSPLLPPTLIKAIATPPPVLPNESANHHQRSDSVRSILANAIGDVPSHTDPKGAPASSSLGPCVRSDSVHSARSATSTGPPTNRHIAALKPGTPNLSPSPSPRRRQRHIIALKYGKKNRKRVEALLKFASRPKKTAPPIPAPKVLEAVQIKTQSDPLKLAQSQSQGGTIRPKVNHDAPVQVKRPTTPIPSIKEPRDSATLLSNGTKSAHATPKKELKSSAMRRVESAEGGDPATPRHKGRSSTPLAVEGLSIAPKLSPGPTAATHALSEDRHAWFEMHQKYFELGRSIKHNATRDHEAGTQKYAVLLVEALLSFMVSNTAHVTSRPSADVWSTIEDYLEFVASGTRKQPHLHGLVLQLGSVCRQQIHKYDIERMAKDPLPEDNVGLAPTPGSDGNTKPSEDGEKYKMEYIKHRNRVVRNARYLQSWWLDGSRRLSTEVLKSDYPLTWRTRRIDFERRGTDRMTPKDVSKGFFLPIDAVTTSFEAVKFALAFLEEFVNVNGVDWEARVVL